MNGPTDPASGHAGRLGAGLLAWVAGGLALALLDGRVDLANLALVLLSAAVVAAVWLPPALSAAGGLAGVAAFNWFFVPPRHSFAVDLRQHALLLAGLLLVIGLVTVLMQRLRQRAREATQQAQREALLRAWGDTLRDADDPALHAGELVAHLEQLCGVPAALLAPDTREGADAEARLRAGTPDADQTAGLEHCLRSGQALGPGSGRHEQQADVYLPLRGRGRTLGAAVLRGLGWRHDLAALRAQAQTLCDLYGQALQRAHEAAGARRASEEAQLQAVRNAFLAAISHDHRTPLAAILGAASALQEQDARLSREQRQALVARIVDEAGHLQRLTDNTLQLARLDAPGLQLACTWESAEELLGAALQRSRSRDPDRRVRVRVEPGLPLLWCDAMLLSQLLDNLVDNALRHSPATAPVELLARVQGQRAMLAVRDRGPGVPPAWRERVFEPFQRGQAPADDRPGAGLGLALCRAVARVHGGDLRLRPRGHGGTAFELWLPVPEQPRPAP